jgi:hypothetical protein
MFQLHPPVLQERGLRAAIATLADGIGRELNADWAVDAPRLAA